MTNNAKNKFTVASLFTGCGGLDLGFVGGFKSNGKKYQKHPFVINWANDIDEPACKTFKNYFKHDIVCGSIVDILNDKHNSMLAEPLPKKVDIVLGGFPCQEFSHAGKRRGFNSEKGLLYRSMAEVIRRTKPMMFVAENVRGLLTIDNGTAIGIIKNDFAKLGYHVNHKLLLAADYGVPQMRERVVIVGTRKDVLPLFKDDDYPRPTHKGKHVSVKEAFGDLENVKEGGLSNHYWSKAKKNKGQGNGIIDSDKPGPTMRTEHHGNIEYHWNGKRRLSAREAARIQSFPDDMEFLPSTSQAYKQIGNAVPPVLAWHIAKSIRLFLDKNLK
ncbi:DNA (cytosine-5-)-methyltransferase [Candidatus Roizmanbacteria bacterium CG_4_9_14_0_2_um_filter_39_13]|uniref:Cytosine-specific methyltransferase n=1 Tax=Candidatus Roizmanbacteria bacterium CG_4_9_14_0_2_um_filter_39_13 TaxID=1974839 RepID=A0A2M8EX17_9BACT|nr:MAG: DNA (cytosine-5-)-methyltransferase [Candidatus Roizmanbacteria bacterium CG_4_9_14_0_2_um_filter_39_13]